MSLDSFITGMDVHYFTWISTFVFLGMASYWDVKERKIPNKLVVSFLVLRIAMATLAPIGALQIYGLIAGYLIIFIPAFIANKPMGGDMKALAVVGFGLGLYNLVPLLALTIVSSFIYYGYLYLRKENLKDIPFAVFYLIGFMLLFSITLII